MANPTAKPSTETMDYVGLAFQATQFLDANGNAVITTQQDNIADAETDHTGDTGNLTVAEGNALGTKINAILDVLEAHGLMADS